MCCLPASRRLPRERTFVIRQNAFRVDSYTNWGVSQQILNLANGCTHEVHSLFVLQNAHLWGFLSDLSFPRQGPCSVNYGTDIS